MIGNNLETKSGHVKYLKTIFFDLHPVETKFPILRNDIAKKFNMEAISGTFTAKIKEVEVKHLR